MWTRHHYHGVYRLPSTDVVGQLFADLYSSFLRGPGAGGRARAGKGGFKYEELTMEERASCQRLQQTFELMRWEPLPQIFQPKCCWVLLYCLVTGRG